VRDIVPNGGSPSGPGAREMSPEQRAAIEAQLQRLQSSRQRRPYQTAHTPIGRGSF
jgi:hypothetical protein